MSIRAKVYIGIICLALAIIVNAITSMMAVNQMSSDLRFLTGPAWDTADGAMEGTIGIQSEIIVLKNLISGDLSKEEATAQLKEAESGTHEALGRMQATGLISRDDISKLNSHLDELQNAKAAVLAASDPAAIKAADQNLKAVADSILGFISELEATGDSKVEATAEISAKVVSRLVNVTMTSIGAALIITLIVFVLARRSVITPMDRQIALLKKLNDGEINLASRLPADGNDEMSQIGKHFNTFMNTVQQLVQQVSSTVDQAYPQMQTIAQRLEEIDSSAHRQNNDTSQVASAITQMTVSLSDVTHIAHDSRSDSSRMRSESEQGQQNLNATVTSIKEVADELDRAAGVISELEADGQSIGNVLEVIRSIAEQTNLLALNAAIEAARAGETGRGFAVVADEVRNLANRTHQSTLEIQTVVERIQKGSSSAAAVMRSSQERAGSVTEQASASLASFDSINSAIVSLDGMNQKISSIIAEQERVSDEVNARVHSISEVASSNALQTQQAVASKDKLLADIDKLRQLSARFKG